MTGPSRVVIAALKGLGHPYPDGELCFCGMRTGNPILTDHSEPCKNARLVLKQAVDTGEGINVNWSHCCR